MVQTTNRWNICFDKISLHFMSHFAAKIFMMNAENRPLSSPLVLIRHLGGVKVNKNQATKSYGSRLGAQWCTYTTCFFYKMIYMCYMYVLLCNIMQ